MNIVYGKGFDEGEKKVIEKWINDKQPKEPTHIIIELWKKEYVLCVFIDENNIYYGVIKPNKINKVRLTGD